MITSSSADESRVKTSMDDILSALFFANTFLKETQIDIELKARLDSSSSATRSSRSGDWKLDTTAKTAKKTAAASSSSSTAVPTPGATKKKLEKAQHEAFMSGLAFCISHFFALAWPGRSTINGKVYTIYSPMRNELQNVLIGACETLFASHLPESAAQGKVVDALSLAKMLCKSFAS